MKNSKLLALNAVAIAILSASSNAAITKQAAIQKSAPQQITINKNENELSFAEWRNQQKVNRSDFTDRLIVTYRNDFSLATLSSASARSMIINRDVIKEFLKIKGFTPMVRE